MKPFFRACGFALLTALILLADGGSLILQKQAGPLTVSLFSSPSPLRGGSADLSAMVQRSADKSNISDARVTFHLVHYASDGISEVSAPATHDKATNKLLYAAQLNLPAEGRWSVTVNVGTKLGDAEVAGAVDVLPPLPPILAYWPYFALVPVLALLFVLNQWLKTKRKRSNRQARA